MDQKRGLKILWNLLIYDLVIHFFSPFFHGFALLKNLRFKIDSVLYLGFWFDTEPDSEIQAGYDVKQKAKRLAKRK